MIGLISGSAIQVGAAKIEAFRISLEEARKYNFWVPKSMAVFPGEYVRLFINGELMMSDTPMERRTNVEFVVNANGHVLIAGLGLGMIVNALREKIKDGDVTQITIIEKEQDVVDMIRPFLHEIEKECQINYITADILEYKPEKGSKFDSIYFDIWPDISPENLPEIAKLHMRFRNYLNRANPNKWMGSWMAGHLRKMRLKEYQS